MLCCIGCGCVESFSAETCPPLPAPTTINARPKGSALPAGIQGLSDGHRKVVGGTDVESNGKYPWQVSFPLYNPNLSEKLSIVVF